MKLRILIVSVVWTLAISALHIGLNVGVAEFKSSIRASLGLERKQLYVGFLPVT